MLKVGDTAPDFTLPDQDGRPVHLADLLARGPVLLYFYPADFTPVCTKEACSFAALEPDLGRAGVTLLGVSPQDSASHARFRGRHGLGFPLLADTERRVIRAYDCEGFLGIRVQRVTYLIGRDGRIQEAVKASMSVAPHMALAKKTLGT